MLMLKWFFTKPFILQLQQKDTCALIKTLSMVQTTLIQSGSFIESLS